MKLIINADDFGMSESINEAIFKLVDLGAISSTTVMINMPFALDIIRLAERLNISIGLHVNITEGFPVSHPDLVKSIIDENGMFYEKNILLKKISQNKINYKDIKTEVWAQYFKLKDLLGNRSIHFDSHQGSTRINMVFSALNELVTCNNIKSSIRVHCKYYLIRKCNSVKIIKPNLLTINELGIKRILIETLLFRKRNKWRKKFNTPDGMLFSLENNTLSLLEYLCTIQKAPSYDGFLEIMCHPAMQTSDLNEFQMPDVRVKEYRILTSNEFQQFLKKVNLFNFNDLINEKH